MSEVTEGHTVDKFISNCVFVNYQIVFEKQKTPEKIKYCEKKILMLGCGCKVGKSCRVFVLSMRKCTNSQFTRVFLLKRTNIREYLLLPVCLKVKLST